MLGLSAAVALSLALDCFSVAIGASLIGHRRLLALKLASSFGAFQSGMFLAGCLGGEALAELIANYDHWMAFAILIAVALHMIRNSLRGVSSSIPSNGIILLAFSIATSIDALAVGFTAPIIGINTLATVLMAGVAAFALTLIGSFAGTRIGERVGGGAGIVGGALLIVLACKIVLDHVFL